MDFSGKAVERAGQLAERAGLGQRTHFVVGDVVSGELPPGPYDAVVVAYLQLPAAQRGAALRRAAEAVAPGGVLLVVAHDSANLHEGYGGPQDAAALYTASDVVGDVAAVPDLTVVRAEQVWRTVQTGDGERVALDVLVRCRRDGSA